MSCPSSPGGPGDLFEFILAHARAGKAFCLRVGGHVGREGVNLLLLKEPRLGLPERGGAGLKAGAAVLSPTPEE